MTTVTSPTLPALPQDAAAFAAREGITQYIQPVLEMTQRLFPESKISVVLEGDPEDSLRWYLLFDVLVDNMEVDEACARRWRWAEEIFQHCPSTEVHFFILGMDWK